MFATKVLMVWTVFSCIAGSFGFGVNYWKLRKAVDEQHAEKHLSGLKSVPENLAFKNPDDQYLTQRLDHFDVLNPATYQQRYWVNDLYWKKPNGPVFLYIGGEGALSSLSVLWGAHVQFAERYGALIFGVEHRYYGTSINSDGLLLKNIKFLSSQQALADLAWFHKAMSEKYNLTERNRWISFGGSYPGSLSAWFRVKYPHLVYASVASSAPVEAQVDFIGYNDVVSSSLNQSAIGGSEKCLAAVNEAFRAVDEMLKDGRRSQLKRDFQACEPISSSLDVYVFTSSLADLFMTAVQYNNEGLLNVNQLCKSMLLPGSAYQNIVSVHKKLTGSDDKCTDYSWSGFLDSLSNTTVANNPGMRQWIYQTCSQFGYYQTCEAQSGCPFSKFISLDPNLKVCGLVFNITKESVYDSVDFTNNYYGSNDPQGSRILFVNGLIDPWHALSVLKNLSSTELTLIIPDTAHCADMRADSSSDPPSLRTARETISRQIGIWLGERVRSQKLVSSRRNFSASSSFMFLHKVNERRQHL